MKRFSRILKWLLLSLLSLGLMFQLIPVKRTNPPVVRDFEGPPEVAAILRRSCYDCHSNEVRWPWYGYVAPVSWLIAHDVEEGRQELNFSEWDLVRTSRHLLGEIYEESAEGEMPLPIYTLMHPSAKLSGEDLGILRAWALSQGARLEADKTGAEDDDDDDD
jgi:hypothetical protein